MGVARERKSVACDPQAASPEPNEIILEPETAETVFDPIVVLDPLETARRRPQRSTIIKRFEDASQLKKNTGKRKARRFFNKRSLEDLPKSDDDDQGFYLLEFYKGPFERLMECSECLNAFLKELEEEEEEEDDDDSRKKPKERKTSDEPYQRICHKIRKALKTKQRKNFPSSQNREVEETLVEFFQQHPLDVFKFLPHNSFERFFLHGVAQYHNLRSVTAGENGTKSVQIRNDENLWVPVPLRLCDFMQREES